MKVQIKRQKRIEKMLVKFTPLFSRYGMDKVTIKMLAEEEGCAESLLYQFFKDKDDIITQCTAYQHAQLQTQLVELLCAHKGDFAQMCEQTLLYIDEHMDTARFLLQILAHPQYAACAKQTSLLVNSLLEQFAFQLHQVYVISKNNALGAALTINSLVNNYILRPDKQAFRLQFQALCRTRKKRPVTFVPINTVR